MTLDDMDKAHEQEQKEARRFYRKNLKGKTIKDARSFLSCLGGLHSLTLYFTDGSEMEITNEGIKLKPEVG